MTNGDRRRTTLTDCPYDIILHLSTYLDARSILVLRTLSCKLSDGLAAPALRRIFIPYWLWTQPVEFPISDHLIPSPWRFEAHTRHLHIVWPTQVDSLRQETMLLVTCGLLPHLRSLRSLCLTCYKTCDPYIDVDKMVLERIDLSFAGSLGMMDGIKELSIWVPRGILLLPTFVTKFRHLERLDVVWMCGCCYDLGMCPSPCDPSEDLEKQITDLITENPSLESVQLDWGCDVNPYSLINVFPSKGSALRRLTISTVRTSNLNSSTMHSLTSLGHLRHLETTSSYTSCNLDPLWTIWAEIGANLETLKTYQVSQAFVDFLSSFSGLQRLCICLSAYDPTSLSPIVANAFFTKALLQHRQTLLQLEIDSTMTSELAGGWSFSPTRWPLSALASLREISVSPPCPSLPDEYLGDEYQQILDAVEEHNARVGVLKIYHSNMEPMEPSYRRWPVRNLKSNLGTVKKIETFDTEYTVDWCAGDDGSDQSGGFWHFLPESGTWEDGNSIYPEDLENIPDGEGEADRPGSED